jgi:hypothetical protein
MRAVNRQKKRQGSQQTEEGLGRWTMRAVNRQKNHSRRKSTTDGPMKAVSRR